MNKKCLIVSLVALVVFHIAPARAALAADPWYGDTVAGWYRPYIYTLWQEGVTDGRVVSPDRSYFYPDMNITHAQLAVLFCKVFGLEPKEPSVPSYPDVPRSYSIWGEKPAWKYIEGALAGGILFVPPGQYFLPSDPIRREDVMELFVRSLNLSDHAESMDEDEVNKWLKRFGDWWSISPDRRKPVACCIKFGLIEGFQNGTIGPRLYMTRAEAVTVMYRSCLIRADASKNVFSPDGDGIDDTVDFVLGYLSNRGISEWQMLVSDDQGTVVKTFNIKQSPGNPPTLITWDGVNDKGKVSANGTYYYQAWVKDRNNRQFFSVQKPLKLMAHSLTAELSPTICKDGGTLTVLATARPEALTVKAVFSNGREIALAKTSKTSWVSRITMNRNYPYGLQNLVVAATFPTAQREKQLSFTHESDLWLAPAITPNPTCPGATLSLTCGAPEAVTQVKCNLLGRNTTMTRDSQTGLWHGVCVLGVDTAPGLHPAIFTGVSGSQTIDETVILEVSDSLLIDLAYILTR